MAWFSSANFTELAKTAISQAQKSIDRALDIKEEDTLPLPVLAAQRAAAASAAAQQAAANALLKDGEGEAGEDGLDDDDDDHHLAALLQNGSTSHGDRHETNSDGTGAVPVRTGAAADAATSSARASPTAQDTAPATLAAMTTAADDETTGTGLAAGRLAQSAAVDAAASSLASKASVSPTPTPSSTSTAGNAAIAAGTTSPEQSGWSSGGFTNPFASFSLAPKATATSSTTSNSLESMAPQAPVSSSALLSKPEEPKEGAPPIATFEADVSTLPESSTAAPIAIQTADITTDATAANEAHPTDAPQLTGEDDSLGNTTVYTSANTTVSDPSSQPETTRLLRVISERERKLVSLSIEHTQLLEAHDLLKSEHDQVRKELASAMTAAPSSGGSRKEEELLAAIREKEVQISELLAEGEKLSKRELVLNTNIKKLNAKCKAAETETTAAKGQVAELESVLTTLRTQVVELQRKEIDYQDSLAKVNTLSDAQGKEAHALRKDLEKAREENAGIKATLDKSFKELTDLRKANAASAKAVQEASFTAEINAKEELKALLERQRTESATAYETLQQQIVDLQASIVRGEQQAQRKEDSLRREIDDLHDQLRVAETRNQELTDSVTQATRPLLRQIETLRNAQSSQLASWEAVEQTLTMRLDEVQLLLSQTSERERLANAKASELAQQLGNLEAQLSAERQARSKVQAQLDVLRERHATLELDATRAEAALDAVRTSQQTELESLRAEKVSLRLQITTMETRVDAESKRADMLKEALERKELEVTKLSSEAGAGLHHSSSSVSINGMDTDATGAANGRSVDAGWARTRRSQQHGSAPATPGLPMASAAAAADWIAGLSATGASPLVIDQFKSILRQRDGEVAGLQRQLEGLTRTQQVMADQLVEMQSSNDELATQLSSQSQAGTASHQAYRELEQRYNALLVLYGERAEEAQELKLDLLDVKSLYRAQIQELVARIESLSGTSHSGALGVSDAGAAP
ncbi:hypothetical protein CAOG_05467 [Capsaspora owczarzaki ATCC 30864]|uniref:TATA element modulatory factor 1 TATA binding domain-containing protein n=1 Tax=Capsaspora owczarzaki (strain ATCC 30864) TaxID=595528 RepID=A0A0D2WS58_CAPO3|nr:hypothetical protein CAOG_05467 [Capsaspora owczarzaki ATCC 30864]KJE94925.1 hypothetical protein CAOG_005467 [Capsaspora owczarzaki ATCC 30864]|eukprot:XP_004346140.1 hypothetical protein CAOG_05467 [Capsaspora owczarzaki ATCC 30864]